MSNFNPSKLSVKYLSPATEFRPVDSRKYTLTHSDATGELFLAIGECYDFNAVNPKFRDEAFAEWIPQMGQYVLSGRVYISGGEFDQQYAKIRFLIFQKELDLALQRWFMEIDAFLPIIPGCSIRQSLYILNPFTRSSASCFITELPENI